MGIAHRIIHGMDILLALSPVLVMSYDVLVWDIYSRLVFLFLFYSHQILDTAKKESSRENENAHFGLLSYRYQLWARKIGKYDRPGNGLICIYWIAWSFSLARQRR